MTKGYPEPPDIRTGKAPEHQANAKNGSKSSVEVSNAKVQPSWYGKNTGEMTNVELNEFYKSTIKSTAIKDFDGKIYINQESIGLPQFDGTTPKMEEFLRKVANRYILIAKEAGYLTKSEEVRRTYNNALIIKLYIRATPKSNVSELPSIDFMVLNHLDTFTLSSVKKVVRD